MSTPMPYLIIFVFTFLTTAFLEARLIPIFSKSAKQPIYAEGPSWHMKKSGTPTMGGIGFIIPVMLACLLFCIPMHISGNNTGAITLFISISFALLNGVIGIIDDLTKLRHKENKGLTAFEKLFLQAVAVILFLAARRAFAGASTSILFFGGELELGLFYYPVTAFILLGIINCANLTDGIDGLAASVAFASSISLFYVSYFSSSESAPICAALIGSTVGFLLFNIHPARIFMGDTGSLFLGALVAAAALGIGGPVATLGFGTVYVIEGISVVIQVVFFKLTGRRVFKMAPLHHHLEKSGWSENKICVAAILVTLLFSALVLLMIV